ncbi:MAG: sulfatase-like hydrolase/transferase [Anaerolineales bacterium]
MNIWRRMPFHVVFLASYPLLALFAANVDQVRLEVLWRPLAITLAAVFILWLLLSWLLRDKMKAGIIVSLLLMLFFSYGQVYEWGQRASFLQGELGRHRYLIPLWTLILIGGVVGILRLRRPRELNHWLNLVSLILVLIPLAQVGSYALRANLAEGARGAALVDPATGEPISLQAPEDSPDVYYIIFDAYARSDVLKESWGIDNSDFLAELEALGFEVTECSQSNYAQTELAFASTLNMAYLDDLGENFLPNRDDRTELRPLIKESLVRQLLQEQGYRTIAFNTGYPFSELRDADIYTTLELAGFATGMTGFEGLLLRSSAGLILFDSAQLLPRFLLPEAEPGIRQHRARALLVLDTLEQMDQFDSPKFVFAHIISPHLPFVFGPGGEARVEPEFRGEDEERQEWYRQGYQDQIAYLNDRIIPMLESILESSDTPPVIILQGDHGPEEGSSRDRMSILNAYYLPEGGVDAIYPEITPVNSFRLVFNQAFGADLPLLPDRSLFSTYNRPYDFNIIENVCHEEQAE